MGKQKKSNCCNAPVILNEVLSKLDATRFYICSSCSQACDIKQPIAKKNGFYDKQ